jgi:hypothetical protein
MRSTGTAPIRRMGLPARNVDVGSAGVCASGIKALASVFRKIQLATVMGRLRAAKRTNAVESPAAALHFLPNPPLQTIVFSC